MPSICSAVLILNLLMVARSRPDASDLQDALNAVLAEEETTVHFQGNFSYCLYWIDFDWGFNFNFVLFMKIIYFLFENISQPPNPKTPIPFESFNPHFLCRTSRWGWHDRTGRRKPHSGPAHRASWLGARLCSHYVERLRPAGAHDMSHCLCLWDTCVTKVSTSSDDTF